MPPLAGSGVASSFSAAGQGQHASRVASARTLGSRNSRAEYPAARHAPGRVSAFARHLPGSPSWHRSGPPPPVPVAVRPPSELHRTAPETKNTPPAAPGDASRSGQTGEERRTNTVSCAERGANGVSARFGEDRPIPQVQEGVHCRSGNRSGQTAEDRRTSKVACAERNQTPEAAAGPPKARPLSSSRR